MLVNIIKYSLKVWLTGVVVAPFLILIFIYCQDYSLSMNFKESILPGLGIYLICIVFELVFSFITWIVFMLAIRLIIKLPCTALKKTMAIFITGILLTVATFASIMLPLGFFDNNSDIGFTIAMIGCNCACIGFGVWFYKLKLPQPSPAVETGEII